MNFKKIVLIFLIVLIWLFINFSNIIIYWAEWNSEKKDSSSCKWFSLIYDEKDRELSSERWIFNCWDSNFSRYTENRTYSLWTTACPRWRRAEKEGLWLSETWTMKCRQPDKYAPYFSNISYDTNNWWKNFNWKKWSNENSNQGDLTTSGTYIMAWIHKMNFTLRFNWDNNRSTIASIKARLDKPDWTSIRMDRQWDYWRYNKDEFEYNYEEQFDFTKVTPHENNGNYAEYKYVIEKICDDSIPSPNCSDNNYTITYKVYANEIYSKNSILENDSVADWTEKKFTFDLKDKYWNKILPVKDWTKEIRSLNFQLEYENNVNLNQYNKTWDWIVWSDFYNWDTSPIFYDKFENTDLNQKQKQFSKKFADNSYKSSIYWFSLKPYSPTFSKDAIDWRQFVDWNAKINRVTVKLSDISTQNTLLEQTDLQYKPMYYTNIEGSLENDWIYPWFRQDSNIKVNKNWTLDSQKFDIFMEFGKFDNKHTSHPEYFMWFDKKDWKNYTILPSREKSSISHKNLENWKSTNNYWNPSTWNNNIYTNVIQKWTTDKVEQNTYFATFIENTFLGGVTSVYPSKVIWMSKYNWNITSEENTFQRPLKIIWNTHSNYTNQVVEKWNSSDKQWEELNKIWNISKTDLQKHIRKKVSDNIRNLKFSLNKGEKIWDTIYYNISNWNDIEINNNSFDNIKNIVIIWGNAYIKSNIIDSNKKVYSIISIEKDWKWWNIFINPKVTKLESTLYADRSVSSYDWTNILTPNTWWTYKELKNQLHIYGSLFSNNTIWGSIKVDNNDKALCPYFIDKKDCTIEEAQKYDLYNLRAWYENLYDLTWWKKAYVDSNLKDEFKINWKAKDVKYPVLIEYNPSLQSAKNPFFTLSK